MNAQRSTRAPRSRRQRALDLLRRLAGALLMLVGIGAFVALAAEAGSPRTDALVIVGGVPVPLSSDLFVLLGPLILLGIGGSLLFGSDATAPPRSGQARARRPSPPAAPKARTRPKAPSQRASVPRTARPRPPTPTERQVPTQRPNRSPGNAHTRRDDGYCARCYQPWPCSYSRGRPLP